MRFAPGAAERAASLGAHREAAAQYARVLRFGDRLEPEERAEFLSLRSTECYLTDENDEAIEAERGALECYRELGDRRREGDSLRSLSSSSGVLAGSRNPSEQARRPSQCSKSSPRGSSSRWRTAISRPLWAILALSRRALELAERVGDTEIAVDALASLGLAESLRGMSEGVEKLTRALELAGRAGLPEQVGRAYDLLSLTFVLHPITRARERLPRCRHPATAASTDSSCSASICSRTALDRSSIRGGGQTPPTPPQPLSAFRARRRCLAPSLRSCSGSFGRAAEIRASWRL